MRAFILLAAAAVMTACGSATNSPGSAQSADACGANPGTLICTTGTPAPTPGPPIPWADCSKAHFGPNLGALNEPADPHVYTAAPAMTIDQGKFYRATITTSRGKIVICLQPHLAPQTVNNFVTLARNHFYDGLTFHRVQADFVIQGGDPLGTGKGGPGYQFADEPVRQAYVLGAVAMANAGPNTNGSQFFIDIADNSSKLAPSYNLFGKVYQGQNVANSIQVGDKMITVTVAEQK